MMRRFQQAFTMVELAVAIVLATMIVAGLYNLFIMQSRQLMFLDLQAEMNQNTRFAADIITRTLRSGGLGTSGGVAGRLGWDGSDDTILPPIISYDSAMSDGSDAITVVHMDPSLTMNTDVQEIPTSATNVLSFDMDMHEYATKIESYRAGEYILCHDFANIGGMESYLWTITSVDTTNGDINVTANSGLIDYDALKSSTDNLAPVMTCSRAEIITFYIDADDSVGPGSEAHPVLMMDLDLSWPDGADVPLVDNIEDLQFAYCLDDSAGTAACSDATSWLDEVAVDDDVWMVRVSLVARSSREEFTKRFSSTRPALENNAGAASDDSYYRQVFSTEVTLRNIRYYSNL